MVIRTTSSAWGFKGCSADTRMSNAFILQKRMTYKENKGNYENNMV